ncbi:MAG: polysaccharide biosynthesis tyrosine autokinase, partial [Roseburia sp.]|nr:polysaccharide biosynthesis tyrosine autokinase [Roseburia sp.]
VVSMQDELNRQKVRIMQTIVSAKRNLNARMANIRELENQSLGQLASTPTIDKGLQEIFREQTVKVNIYTFLLQRREEIALQKTLATNTARLIDDPIADAPVSPKKMLILAASFLLGLLIPGLIIFVRRSLFPVFSDQEELERMTNVPVLGEICSYDRGTHDDMVVGENVSTPIAELFRLLRNNINFINRDKPVKVILVTSAISGEGKTFIATNLALTYALAGKKVLVIGADVRRPVLARRFGLDNQRGLTTYLSGQEHNLDRLIVPSQLNPNLFILPAGPVPPNPNELLMSPNMDKLMETLRAQYDYVIIDSAPIGVISDSFLIVHQSDVQLFVTRANYSSRGSLKTLHNAVNLKKLTNVYVVVNGVNIRSGSYLYRRYGAYSTSRKSYGYGYPDSKK